VSGGIGYLINKAFGSCKALMALKKYKWSSRFCTKLFWAKNMALCILCGKLLQNPKVS